MVYYAAIMVVSSEGDIISNSDILCQEMSFSLNAQYENKLTVRILSQRAEIGGGGSIDI